MSPPFPSAFTMEVELFDVVLEFCNLTTLGAALTKGFDVDASSMTT